MDMLDDDDVGQQVDEIFIAPPEVNVDTDEDSGDEDEGGTIYNLTGRQLRAAAEIKLTNNVRIGGADNNEEQPDEPVYVPRSEQVAGSIPQQTAVSSVGELPTPDPHNENMHWINNRIKHKNNPKWIHGDLEPMQRPFPAADYSRYKNMSCTDIFELFLDEDTIRYIADETQRYSLYKNDTDPKISISEIRCFIGILILSGYNHLPSKRMYWDMKEDLNNKMVVNAMRRNRFLQLQKYIHMVDNTQINESDKVWKLRPIMDRIKQKCLAHFEPIQNLSYDESMVKYYGRHGCKQFIRGKPIRFGYKMWSLNSRDGYLIDFDLYQGNNPRGDPKFDALFGKAASPMVLMMQEIPQPNLPYIIHMDNLFTNANLLAYLRHLGYGAVGTIRENRIPKSCPLTDKNKFKKKNRGEYEYVLEKNDGIIYSRWMDNAVVTIASTNYGVEPLGSAKRYSKKDKRNIMVCRPQCVAAYNSMGGTDLMDQGIANYRIGVRGKKWYWPIFTWLIDAAIQNAWFIYKQNNGNISNLDFRREIVQVYLTKYGTPPKVAGRTSLTRNILPDIRFDRIDHFVASCSRRRCAGAGCKSFGRTMCKKCNVGLCINCFIAYHSK